MRRSVAPSTRRSARLNTHRYFPTLEQQHCYSLFSFLLHIIYTQGVFSTPPLRNGRGRGLFYNVSDHHPLVLYQFELMSDKHTPMYLILQVREGLRQPRRRQDVEGVERNGEEAEETRPSGGEA